MRARSRDSLASMARKAWSCGDSSQGAGGIVSLSSRLTSGGIATDVPTVATLAARSWAGVRMRLAASRNDDHDINVTVVGGDSRSIAGNRCRVAVLSCMPTTATSMSDG
jgi:hypothetical protein